LLLQSYLPVPHHRRGARFLAARARLRALENELIALKEGLDHKSREFALVLDQAIEHSHRS
jgi:hypothetical protein